MIKFMCQLIKQVLIKQSTKMMEKYSLKAVEQKVELMKAEKRQNQAKIIKKINDQFQLNYYKCRRYKGHCFKYNERDEEEKMTYQDMEKYFHIEAQAKRLKISCAEKEASIWREQYKRLFQNAQKFVKNQISKRLEKMSSQNIRKFQELKLQNQSLKKKYQISLQELQSLQQDQKNQTNRLFSSLMEEFQKVINSNASETLLQMLQEIKQDQNSKQAQIIFTKVKSQLQIIMQFTSDCEAEIEEYQIELKQKNEQIKQKTQDIQQLMIQIQQYQNQQTAVHQKSKVKSTRN